VTKQPDALAVLLMGFEELVEDLKQIAVQDVELKSPPNKQSDRDLLVLQHRAAFQLAAVERFLARHVDGPDMLPLRALLEAMTELTKARPNALLHPVKTKLHPTGRNASPPEHWHVLRELVVVGIERFMKKQGLTRKEAAKKIGGKLSVRGIRDPRGYEYGWKTILRWHEGGDIPHIRKQVRSNIHQSWDDAIGPDALVDELLIRWRNEAEARGYRFSKKPKSIVKRKLSPPD
jgi:hypothetical protein